MTCFGEEPMAKSKRSSKLRKIQPFPAHYRAVLQNQNDQRVDQLVKSAKMRGRVAKQFASMFGLTSDSFPAGLQREFQNAAEAISGKRLRRFKR
jgi:hypothetical protein